MSHPGALGWKRMQGRMKFGRSASVILILLLIVAAAFALRLYRLNEPNRYIIDEKFYGLNAENMVGKLSERDLSAYRNIKAKVDPGVDWGNHPPLAKYMMALSILVFGDSHLAVRLPSALLGTLSVILIFFLARNLLRDSRHRNSIALSSAFLMAFDNMMLNLSRLAMLDIYVIFFTLVAVWLLSSDLRQRTVLSAISFSAALLSKEQAAITLPFLLFFLWMRGGRWRAVIMFLSATVSSTLLLWGLIDWILLKPRYPSLIDRIFAIARITSYSTPENLPFESPPWLWLVNQIPFGYRRVYGSPQEVERVIAGPLFEPSYGMAYWLLHNPVILAFTIPVLAYLGYLAIRRKHVFHRTVLFWWLSLFLIYVLINLTLRPTFIHYSAILILPIYIGSAYLLHEERLSPDARWLSILEKGRDKLRSRPIIALIYLGILVAFLYYYPVGFV